MKTKLAAGYFPSANSLGDRQLLGVFHSARPYNAQTSVDDGKELGWCLVLVSLDVLTQQDTFVFADALC